MSELAANIAVRVRVGEAASAVLTYRVPARLHNLIHPGRLVWVPLRSQVVQGVVLHVYDAASQPEPAFPLRPVSDIADPEAIIPPAGLQLAEWLGETYRAPLYDVLALLLPPGVSQQAETLWQVTPQGRLHNLGALPERERAVLYYLRRHGARSERDLGRELEIGKQALREACLLLHEQGLLERGMTISAPKARPRVRRLARLLLPADEVASVLEDLARAPKQRAVLEWLAAQSAQEAWPVSDICAATGASLAVLHALEQRALLALEEQEVRRDPLIDTAIPPDDPPPLTPGQRRVWEPLSAALDAGASQTGDEGKPQKVFLLHGVTGSGKTEIYLRAVARAMRKDRQALVLVPEIALTAQLVRRFAARFPGKVAVLHSSLSAGERYDEWRRLRRGEARLAIGSRSAVFAPLPDLGLIIVDEEHEPGYKHDGSTPRYHARDVALHLGSITGSVVILGSATPAIETYYAAQQGHIVLLSLPERVGSAAGADGLPDIQPLPLPRVRLIDMRQELQHDNRSIFSHPLHQALGAVLERGEQAILFLNRRGAATFVMCRDCGHVVVCPRCNGSLVVHYAGSTSKTPDETTPTTPDTQTLLVCHGCGHRTMVPAFCSQCLSPRIKSFGIGTQRIEEEVRRLFPGARPLRWDRDSASGKGAHDQMLDQFLRHEADVLIGTQMIAKGLDLPRVALVGVVAADTGLYLPDFRSGERTFQLLTQVAGRAGRRSAGAQVIIQTYTPEHYALRAAQEHDYRAFYIQEIGFRRQVHYPPFSHLVRFVYASSSSAACQREANALAERLHTLAEQMHLEDWSLIGPAPAFFQRMRGRWRWHLMLRATDPAPLLAALGTLPGWMVDIDPVHVL